METRRTDAVDAIVIGAGFSGLSAAITLAANGRQVHVVEKHATPGGRARNFEHDGFVFDMGPSWHWMPEVLEQLFEKAGYRLEDFVDIVRLDPSYRVWFENEVVDLPSGRQAVRSLFETLEPNCGQAFDAFMNEAAKKYELGIKQFVWQSGDSILDYVRVPTLAASLNMSMFGSLSSHIKKHFSDPRIVQLLEFPVLFLGTPAAKAPALYSLMNHADISLGTWYPQGGIFKLIEALYKVALSLGVKFHFEESVEEILIDGKQVAGVRTSRGTRACRSLVASADYQHVEQNLVPKQYRRYNKSYWTSRKMSPSALIFYVGVDVRLPDLHHHNLFFDVPFESHSKAIFNDPSWPDNPQFYVAAPSRTDTSVAPPGHENLFILVPVASNLSDTPEDRERLFDRVADRIMNRTGTDIRPHIVYKRSYAHADFSADYNSFQGNAYGLANTIDQTGFLKPKMKSKLRGLFFAGQLTTPGPGVPPSLISGQLAAQESSNWLSEFRAPKMEVAG